MLTAGEITRSTDQPTNNYEACLCFLSISMFACV